MTREFSSVTPNSSLAISLRTDLAKTKSHQSNRRQSDRLSVTSLRENSAGLLHPQLQKVCANSRMLSMSSVHIDQSLLLQQLLLSE